MNRLFRRAALVLLLAFLSTPLTAFGQEWTRFRGPNGSGVSETNFPPTFAAKDFAWNIELPGIGHSSPVVWGDKVFVTSADAQNVERTILCYSTKDGSLIWKKEYGAHAYKHHNDNSYASATPAVDADRVYVCFSTPDEYSLAAVTHDGKEAWKTNLGGFVSQHGNGNSPIVVGDMIILGDDQEDKAPSFVFGIDCKTGEVKWKTPRKTAKFAASSPIVFHPKTGPDQVVLTSQGEGMVGYDPKTGKEIWHAAGVFDSRTVGSPTTADGLIFATCGEGPGGHVLVAIRPGADGTAEVAWKVKSETPYVPTPLVKGDVLYYWSDRGMLTSAHAATGEKIWQEHVPLEAGGFYCSPVCAGNTLFNISKSGVVVAIRAGEKFEVLGQTALNDKCTASPAIAGGRMFIRTYGHLICVKGVGGNATAGND